MRESCMSAYPIAKIGPLGPRQALGVRIRPYTDRLDGDEFWWWELGCLQGTDNLDGPNIDSDVSPTDMIVVHVGWKYQTDAAYGFDRNMLVFGQECCRLSMVGAFENACWNEQS